MPSPRTTASAAAPTTPLIARKANRIRQPQRRRTVFRLIFLLLFLGFVYIIVFGVSPKKNEYSGAPVEGQYTVNLVAVGDLHGDYDNALKVLKMANVVNEEGNWSGKVDWFVQTGDIVDRGLDTIKIYTWLENLRSQARGVGGNIFSHLGNHEYMNALGDWRYVPRAEISTFGGVAKRQTALTTGPIGAAWASNYTAVSRIPLHPFSGLPNADFRPSASNKTAALSHSALSFMHGGLSPVFAEAYGSPYPSRINGIAALLLRRCQTRTPQPSPHPPAPYAGLPPGSTTEEAHLYSADGPFWYRGWAEQSEVEVCSKVDAVMKQIGVRRLIMGHTPNFEKIVSRCGGKIIIIDTGISKAYGGRLSALGITYTLTPIPGTFNDTASTSDSSPDLTTPIEANASASVIDAAIGASATKKGKGVGKWKEQELVRAIYLDEEVQLVLTERDIEGDFW